MWDSLAAAYLIDPGFVTKSETRYLDVMTAWGKFYGSTVPLDRRVAPDATPVLVALELDYQRVFALYKDKLTRARMKIAQVESAAELAQVKGLFEEYWASFGFAPCFQNFGDEMAALPGPYAPPGGRLGLAIVDGEAGGMRGGQTLRRPPL